MVMERSEEIEELVRRFYDRATDLDPTTGEQMQPLDPEASRRPPTTFCSSVLIQTSGRNRPKSSGSSLGVSTKRTRAGRASLQATCAAGAKARWGGRSTGPASCSRDRPDVPLRLSAVARLEPAGWRLIHVHLSIGVRNEESIGRRLTTSIDELVTRGRLGPDAESLPHGEVTIVFSDIEASTEHLIRLGEGRWMEILRSHNRTVRNAVGEHDGREVKSEGDGFMLAFYDCACGAGVHARDATGVAHRDSQRPGSPDPRPNGCSHRAGHQRAR